MAAAPALFADECVMGLPNLSESDAAKVDLENVLMRFSAGIAEICLRRRIPFCIKSPWSSRIWMTKQFQSLQKSSHVHFGYTDFCGDGTLWRKRTGLLHGFVDLGSCCKRCNTRGGICSFSGKRHAQQMGQCQGVFLTRAAEPYPQKLCRRVAKAFVASVLSRWCSNLWERLS
ncbi:Kidins220 [Symbiodinium natans]|uniref:Kidins220 protein n=1 Tax=Symbiodinium natans TaxID=878477 RepID=A0A812K3H8_9DINO|nr:Kidins220 [Symbiodinium natans]